MSNTINWGKIHGLSYSPETNLTGTAAAPSFTNTKSIELDGIDAYVETTSNYTLLDGESKATISAWVNLQTGSSSDYLCAIKEIGAINFTLGVRLQISGSSCSVRVQTQNASNQNRATLSLGNIVNDGLWHHLLICVDLALTSSNELQVFLDGVSKGVSGRFQNTTFTSVNAPLYVGHADSYNYLNGNIDEFAIWSGVDFRSDAATIYNSGLPNDLNNNGLTAPTTWYRFEEGSGTTISDSAGSANATIENDVTFSTDVPT